MESATLFAYSSILIISLISLIGVFSVSLNEKWLRSILPFLVALAAGALIGNSAIHLIPEALEELPSKVDFAVAFLFGIFGFFILERALHWHHTHFVSEQDCVGSHCHQHNEQAHLGVLVVLADVLHNFIDGIAIAAAYLVSVEVGIAATIAVIVHEIPQEISDFSLLLYSGMSRVKALFYNFFSALTAFIGAFLMFGVGSSVELAVPYAAAITAGGFLYIAIGDLIPTLHKETQTMRIVTQLAALFIGIAVMFFLALNGADAH